MHQSNPWHLLLLVPMAACSRHDRTEQATEAPALPARTAPSISSARSGGLTEVAYRPTARPNPGSNHWVRCAAGFRATAEASVDVLRLGLACGPANGMVRFGPPMSGRIDEQGAEGHHRTEPLEPGDCVRLAAAADDGVVDLEIEIADLEDNEVLARTTVDRRWAIVPEDEPLCVETKKRLGVTVRTYGGQGRYTVDGWHFP